MILRRGGIDKKAPFPLYCYSVQKEGKEEPVMNENALQPQSHYRQLIKLTIPIVLQNLLSAAVNSG